MVKLIFSLIALVVAFLFTFIFPGAGFEQAAIVIIASIAGQFGLTSWRTDFDLIEGWMKSKTIVGALIVIIPLIICVILPFVWDSAPVWIIPVLGFIAIAGGGTVLFGILGVKKPDLPAAEKTNGPTQ